MNGDWFWLQFEFRSRNPTLNISRGGDIAGAGSQTMPDRVTIISQRAWVGKHNWTELRQYQPYSYQIGWSGGDGQRGSGLDYPFRIRYPDVEGRHAFEIIIQGAGLKECRHGLLTRGNRNRNRNRNRKSCAAIASGAIEMERKMTWLELEGERPDHSNSNLILLNLIIKWLHESPLPITYMIDERWVGDISYPRIRIK